MQSIAKSQATMRDLASVLQLRLAGSASINSVRQAADAQGWPMLFLSVGGNEAAGQPVIALRMKGLQVAPKDIFQQTQYAYAPHTMEVLCEQDANGKPTPSSKDMLIAEFEAIKTGVAILQKESANTVAVTEASMNAAAVISELNDAFWPNKGV